MTNGLSRFFVLFFAVILLSGCAEARFVSHLAKQMPFPGYPDKSQGVYKVGKPYKIKGVKYYPKEDFQLVQTGIASWYGPGFHGKKTANGEIYDQYELTAAHKTLQLPSLVRVTNLENGRSIVVRVNDRGPYAHGRIIDLSKRSAELLGFKNQGTAKVKIADVVEHESRALAAAAKSGEDTTRMAYNDLGQRKPQASQPISYTPPRQARASQPQTAPRPAPVTPDQDIAVLKNDARILTPEPVEAAPLDITPDMPGTETPVAANSVSANSGATNTASEAGNDAFLNELDFIKQTRVEGHTEQGRFLPDPVVEQGAVRSTSIYVQAGSFTVEENASRLGEQLQSFAPVKIERALIKGRQFYRVRLGPLQSVDQADIVLAQVIGEGHTSAQVIVD